MSRTYKHRPSNNRHLTKAQRRSISRLTGNLDHAIATTFRDIRDAFTLDLFTGENDAKTTQTTSDTQRQERESIPQKRRPN